jgi:hypothetical protein
MNPVTHIPCVSIPLHPLDRESLSILAQGNTRQRAAFDCIVRHDFFGLLSQFRGVLASTIALGIHTPTSDLDFLCEVQDLDRFADTIQHHFGHLRDFSLVTMPVPSESRGCSFWCDDFEIEVFGSTVRLEAQFGFRHYTVMARLIKLGGDAFCDKLRAAKLAGLKSEPAVAAILSLPGNPYESVAALSDSTDAGLLELIQEAKK